MLTFVTTGVSVISVKMLHFRNPILYILFYSLQVLSSKESAPPAAHAGAIQQAAH